MAQTASNTIAANVVFRSPKLNDAVQNIDKACWRLGTSEDQIRRHKALHTLGGREETFQATLKYFSQNHQAQHTNNLEAIKNIEMQKSDPLEAEYTAHSRSSETVNQSSILKRSSNSYS
eukprot:358283_1